MNYEKTTRKESIMKKKLLVTVLVLAMSTNFFACGMSKNEPKEVEDILIETENEEVETDDIEETDNEVTEETDISTAEADIPSGDGSRENPYHFGEELVFKNISRSYQESTANDGYTLKITIDEAWPEGESNDAVQNVPVFKYHFVLLHDEETNPTPSTGLFRVNLICDPYEGGTRTEYDGCKEREMVPGEEYSAIVFASEHVKEVTPKYVRIEISPNTDNTHEQIFIAFPE